MMLNINTVAKGYPLFWTDKYLKNGTCCLLAKLKFTHLGLSQDSLIG